MALRALYRLALICLVCAVRGPDPARAQSAVPEDRRPYLTHTFLWENDDPYATDQHYTNGLRYSRAVTAPPRWVHRMRANPFWKALVFGANPCDIGERGGCTRIRTGFTFGQNLYTPRNIVTRAPQPHDRPYAATLYVGRTFELVNEVWQHEMEYDVGIIGPLALGESVQVGWHDLWGFSTPSGWHHQLHTGPLVQVIGRSHLGLPQVDVTSDVSAQLLPRVQVVLGTPMTNARVGGVLRFGRNVPRIVESFIPSPPPPPAPPSGTAMAAQGDACACTADDAEAASGWTPGERLPRNREARREILRQWQRRALQQHQDAVRPRSRPAPLYVFAAADVTGVAHNALLQGVPLRDDNPAAPPMERVYTEVQAGFVFHVVGADFTIRRLWRSGEFQGDDPHRTWTLGVTW